MEHENSMEGQEEVTEFEVKELIILSRVDELDRMKELTDDAELIAKIEERKKALRSQLPVT